MRGTNVRTEDISPVRHVIIGRPEKRNALSSKVYGELREAFVAAARARMVRAEEALCIGLVNRVAAPGRLDAVTADLIDELMANGAKAVGLAQRIHDAAAKPALAVTLEMEVTAQDTLVRTQDFAQRVHEYRGGRRPS